MKSIVIVSPTARTPHADKPIDVLVKPSSEIAVSMIRSSATEHVVCPWAEDREEAKQVVKSRAWLTKEGTTCIIRFRRKAHCQIQPIDQPCAGSSPLARLCPRQSRQFEDYCGTPRQSHQLHCNPHIWSLSTVLLLPELVYVPVRSVVFGGEAGSRLNPGLPLPA